MSNWPLRVIYLPPMNSAGSFKFVTNFLMQFDARFYSVTYFLEFRKAFDNEDIGSDTGSQASRNSFTQLRSPGPPLESGGP